MSTFKSVVETEKLNGRTQQKQPLTENKNPDSRSNQEQGMYKFTKGRKGVESHTIAICVEARADACGKNPIEKGGISTGKKVYIITIKSTYKEIELS